MSENTERRQPQIGALRMICGLVPAIYLGAVIFTPWLITDGRSSRYWYMLTGSAENMPVLFTLLLFFGVFAVTGAIGGIFILEPLLKTKTGFKVTLFSFACSALMHAGYALSYLFAPKELLGPAPRLSVWLIALYVLCFIEIVLSAAALCMYRGGKEPAERREHPPEALPGLSGGSVTGLSGAYRGTIFNMRMDEMLTIGRDAAFSQIVIEQSEQTASRHHCTIEYSAEKGVYTVRDLSSNGTYLEDGTRLPYDSPTELPKNTVILLGTEGHRFRLN